MGDFCTDTIADVFSYHRSDKINDTMLATQFIWTRNLQLAARFTYTVAWFYMCLNGDSQTKLNEESSDLFALFFSPTILEEFSDNSILKHWLITSTNSILFFR